MIEEWLTNTLVGCRISLSYIFGGCCLNGLCFSLFHNLLVCNSQGWSRGIAFNAGAFSAFVERILPEPRQRDPEMPRTDQLANIRILQLGGLGTRFSWDVGFSRNSFIPQYMAIESLIGYFFPAKCRSRTWGALFFWVTAICQFR